jgi:hypothetical protein
MMRSYLGAIIALSAGAYLSLIATQSHADERCKQLDTLRVKYAGVELTADQKVLKVKMTAWYIANCGKHEVADVKSVALSNTIR